MAHPCHFDDLMQLFRMIDDTAIDHGGNSFVDGGNFSDDRLHTNLQQADVCPAPHAARQQDIAFLQWREHIGMTNRLVWTVFMVAVVVLIAISLQ